MKTEEGVKKIVIVETVVDRSLPGRAPGPVSISLNNASSLCGRLNYSAVIGSEPRAREG